MEYSGEEGHVGALTEYDIGDQIATARENNHTVHAERLGEASERFVSRTARCLGQMFSL